MISANTVRLLDQIKALEEIQEKLLIDKMEMRNQIKDLKKQSAILDNLAVNEAIEIGKLKEEIVYLKELK